MRKHTDSSKNDVLSKYLTVLGNCYSTGVFDELFPLLAEDAVMESQWVLEPNTGKDAVVGYYTGKGKTLRAHNCCPHCWLIQLVGNMNKVDNAELHVNGGAASRGSVALFYPDGKYAMFMAQTLNDVTNGVVVDLTLDESDMIARIDLCMPELFKFEIVQSVDATIDADEDGEEEDDNEPDDEEIEAHIQELLSGNPDEFDEIEEYIGEVEEHYSDDLSEFTFREAIRCGATNYVEAYAGDFDLNDGDGYSTYLYETEDPNMQEILMDHGAFKSWDDYADCRFAVETVNGEILAFDSDFQVEVFEKYLEFTGLTKAKIIQMLDEDYDQDEDDELPEDLDRYFEEDFEAMGISAEDGDIAFSDMIGDGGYSTKELLEELGWDCSFEGDSWKLETLGVYFID